MSDANRRKQLLLGFLQEVWSEGDIEACDKYLAPRYTIHHDPGDPWERQQLDLEGFKERVRRSRAPFPDQRFKVRELFAEDSAAVVAWLWSGTHRGDLPGFPASGRSIQMSGITVYYFKGDRIAGHWQVTDRLGVFQQLQRRAATGPALPA